MPSRVDVLVADTVEDYAAAVIRLLRDPALRSRLAENGSSWRKTLRLESRA